MSVQGLVGKLAGHDFHHPRPNNARCRWRCHSWFPVEANSLARFFSCHFAVPIATKDIAPGADNPPGPNDSPQELAFHTVSLARSPLGPCRALYGAVMSKRARGPTIRSVHDRRCDFSVKHGVRISEIVVRTLHRRNSLHPVACTISPR